MRQRRAEYARSCALPVSNPALTRRNAGGDSQLRRLLDFSLDAAYVHVDDVLVYANEATARIAGATDAAAMLGLHASAFMDESDRERLLAVRRQIFGGGRTDAVFEFQFIALDGRRVETESTGVEIDWEGRRAILVFARDVSRRKQAEARLRKSEANLRGILEGFPQAVYVHADDKLLYVNPRMVELFGYGDPEELVGRSSLTLFHPSSRERVLAARAAIAGGRNLPTSTLETDCLHRDGSTFTVLGTGRGVEWEGQKAVVVGLHDIDERLRAERELRDSTARFRSLFELTPDAVYIHIHDRIAFANPAAARQFGYRRPEDMVGRSALALFAPEHHADITSLRATVPDNSRTTSKVFRFVREDGTHFDGDTVGAPVVWDEEEARLVFVRDLTDRIRTEEQLYHAQKMDALGKMTAGVAHEFNNFLTVISGFAQMASRDPTNASRVTNCLDEVCKAASVAATLTQRMLAFGRKNEIEPEVISVGRILSDLRSMLVPMLGEQVRLDMDACDESLLALIDRHQFAQAIVNIAINAGHAMPKGGILTVSCNETRLDQTAAKGLANVTPGRYVLTSVADTGAGMDHETLGHIFEPFFTTKPSGSGLGLAVVYGMVRAAGGAIDVHSSLGKGTRFDIYLPLAEPEAPSPPDAGSGRQTGGGATVLVVEDKPAVLALARMALEDAGFAVLTAPDGQAAAALFAPRAEEIDLLLTDIAMPGMNGPELARRLREQCPELKVMLMSGHAAFGNSEALELNRETSFMQKPFDTDDLCEQITAMLERG